MFVLWLLAISLRVVMFQTYEDGFVGVVACVVYNNRVSVVVVVDGVVGWVVVVVGVCVFVGLLLWRLMVLLLLFRLVLMYVCVRVVAVDGGVVICLGVVAVVLCVWYLWLWWCWRWCC